MSMPVTGTSQQPMVHHHMRHKSASEAQVPADGSSGGSDDLSSGPSTTTNPLDSTSSSMMSFLSQLMSLGGPTSSDPASLGNDATSAAAGTPSAEDDLAALLQGSPTSPANEPVSAQDQASSGSTTSPLGQMIRALQAFAAAKT